ncbi:venom allergen 3-like [Cloeon dipterum]|uniref:venom allergen 3-like n=1 Tax=Cloeon dipterum TaxID=197152 RepID=UPI00321FCDAB
MSGRCILFVAAVAAVVVLVAAVCPYQSISARHTICTYRTAACRGKAMLRSGGLGCTDKQVILDTHNQLRQSVALGHVAGQPPAAGMREMVWDEELAAIAQRWADQCTVGHDAERSTGRFPVGQNVAATWTHGTPSPAGPTPDFRKQIEDWFSEVMRWGFRRSDLEHFLFSEHTGHYSQLVWSDTYLVGCGYSYFKDPQRGYTKLYVCNYGPGGNVLGEHLYQPGQADCSGPELTPSRRYAGLCEARGSNPPGLFCSAHDAHLFTAQSPYRDHHHGAASQLHPVHVVPSTVMRPPPAPAQANFLSAILPRTPHYHFFG